MRRQRIRMDVNALTYKLSILTDYELGYLAGLIDGEGYIVMQIVNKNKRPSFGSTVGICNTDERIHAWLENKIGGVTKWDPGCPSPTKPNGKVKYMGRWVAHGRACLAVVSKVSPLLIIKRDKAECIVRYYASISKKRTWISDEEFSRRSGIYAEMCALRRKIDRVPA